MHRLAHADRHPPINDEGSRVHENKTPTLRAHDNQAMILQARAVLPAPTVTRRRRLPRTRRSAPGSLALAFPSSLAQPLSPSRPRPLALSPSRPLALSCPLALSLPHVLAPPRPLLLARCLLALSPALSPARSLARGFGSPSSKLACNPPSKSIMGFLLSFPAGQHYGGQPTTAPARFPSGCPDLECAYLPGWFLACSWACLGVPPASWVRRFLPFMGAKLASTTGSAPTGAAPPTSPKLCPSMLACSTQGCLRGCGPN